MTALNFLMGLAVGLGIYVLQQYRYKRQLKNTLRSFSRAEDGEISLPLQSLIRRELSDLDRQRKQLERDKQAWQDLIEQAPIGYLQVDAENQLLGCNLTAKELLRIDSRRSLRVRLLLELVRSYDLDLLIEETRRSQRCHNKEWIFYFTRYVLPQDPNYSPSSEQPLQKIVESIALKGYGFPLSNQQVGVFIENRQPLVELSQSRDRTFSDLTHELRTPLTSISLVAENLLRRLQNPERRWVEQMLIETNRLIDLVQEWLDLSQLDAPNRALKYENIRLYNLIQSVWQTLEPIAHKKDVSLSYRGDRNIIIAGDKARLIQVFLNLLDNAIKHNPAQKEILVQVSALDCATTSDTNRIKIDVIDSGLGFNASDLPHIFERLYRGDKSRLREQQNQSVKAGGSGLGLAIVEQIIQAHGGVISAKNHPEIGGAWLEIILPTDKK
ncbi:MAG: HAMP domain-containing sensor histidine kinase [Cyanobacteria bacterium P01_A01_bin.83]